jgi:SAM-dependent methyltransferase
MTDWDERFRTGSYPQDPDPSPVLRQYLDDIPTGRALDVATGTGRNAVSLAAAGYTVDALDKSREGLDVARENASERGVAQDINWIQADVPRYAFPTAEYQLVTISFYRAIDRFPDIAEALAPGGYLFVEHHLRTTAETSSGPADDRYRVAANELLRAGLDLTVLYYDETAVEGAGDERRATARLLARNSSGTTQSYPRRP